MNYPWIKDRTREEDLLRLAILKEKAEYRSFWLEHGGDKIRNAYQRITEHYDKGGDPGEVAKICRVEIEQADIFVRGLYGFGIILPDVSPLLEDSFAALDPFVTDSPSIIPFNFREASPIIQVDMGGPLEHNHVDPYLVPLKPSERLLKVDLSRKRGELLEEFKRFLDAVDYFRASADVPQRYSTNYEEWGQDRTRQVKEAWRHLEVWRQRRLGKPFFQIAGDLSITNDQAKDSFTRAYELIEGRKYDREHYREHYRETLAQEVTTPCQRCKEAASCDPLTDNCKKMLDYWDHIASQVEGGRREQLIDDLAPEKQRKIGAF